MEYRNPKFFKAVAMMAFMFAVMCLALLFMPSASATDAGMMAYDTGDSGGVNLVDWLLGLGAVTLFILGAVSYGLSKGLILKFGKTGRDVNCDQAEFNISISRMDVGLGNAIATCHLGNVPYVDVDGGNDEAVIEQTANNEYKVKWTKSDASYHYEDVSILLESAETDSVSLNITLADDAFDEATIYDSYTVPITIAGELWTLELMVIAVA